MSFLGITESPRLFRLTPWLIAGVGLMLTVVLVFLVQRRIEDGWRDSVNSGFFAVNSIATAVESQSRARLQAFRQAAFTLDQVSATGADEATLRELFARNLGLPNTGGIETLWVAATGRVKYASSGSAVGFTHSIVDWMAAYGTELNAKEAVLLPPLRTFAREGVGLGLVRAHQIGRESGYLLLTFHESAYINFVRRTLNGRDGIIAICDFNGRPLIAATAHRLLDARDLEESEAVMADSTQMLADAPTHLPRYLRSRRIVEGERAIVYAAVSEYDTLTDWRQRRSATISMTAMMGALILACLFLAAWALRSLVRNESSLRKLVALDTLTELPNRRTFNQLLAIEVERSAAQGKPTGLMFIDLDNFKYVNDSLGHEVGDLLLKSVAQRLRESVRDSDVVCRLGGDEFTVVLPDASSDALQRVAHRILVRLAEPVVLAEKTVVTNASIGVAVAVRDAHTASDLVRCADMAVYTAKERGKGCVAFYAPEMGARSHERSLVAQELRAALQRDELFMAYQPKVALTTGEVSGFEALIRWHHPEKGLVSPATFIPIAEDFGLIVEIGDFVVRKVVDQLRQWHAQGRGWQRVAVNVSARQLSDDSVVTTIRNALREFDVPGCCLQVELTETMLAQDMAQAERVLAKLKAMDVRISVDDFGTGYSSLSALQQLDVDCIKVDQSFVAGIGRDHDSNEICRAIVNLAHSLKLTVIAEGVETREQYQYLRALGCNEGQGYLFARPLLPEEAIGYETTSSVFANFDEEARLAA